MGSIKQLTGYRLLIISFGYGVADHRVLDELQRLRKSKQVRVADAVMLRKDRRGRVQVSYQYELPHDEAIESGTMISQLEGQMERARAVAACTPAGGLTALLLLEQVWTLPIRDAIEAAGGVVLAQDQDL